MTSLCVKLIRKPNQTKPKEQNQPNKNQPAQRDRYVGRGMDGVGRGKKEKGSGDGQINEWMDVFRDGR